MLLLSLAACARPGPAQAPPPAVLPGEVDPASVQMDPEALVALDSLIEAAIADGAVPGAALAVGRRGKLVRLRGYGVLGEDDATPVDPSTIYDLASVTKVVGTTTAVMMLLDEGRIDLDDRVVEFLPAWAEGDPRKARVTLRQLLLHRSGLPPFRRWFFEIEGRDAYQDAIRGEPLEADPGTRTAYSDIGVMTLAWVVETVAGERLDRFLERRLFTPLGMADTGFVPDAALRPRIAPTELDTLWRREMVRGRVHDENADAYGGVAGHAGLFSTARDLAVFAEMMRSGGAAPPCDADRPAGEPCPRTRPGSQRLLEEATVRGFTRRADSTSSRALGWDTPSGRSSAGDLFSAASFGHTGFTGTSLWVDPEREVFVVLLTNRVHPTRANSRHVPLRRAVHDAVARAVRDVPAVARESGDRAATSGGLESAGLESAGLESADPA
ncbi:MAG: beta-lactamase family protein [Gemmatimonadetes bacterium]|nr:beta-lactamase family protein [Gemmatimonadota bacterium]